MEELETKYPNFNENKIKGRRTRLFTLIKRPDACFYYRIMIPQQQLSRQFGWECKYNIIDPLPHQLQAGVPNTLEEGNSEKSFKNLIDCHGENLEWADIINMQRPTCDHHLELMRYIQKELKKPVIFSADDNYIDVPKWNPGYKYFTPRAQYIKEMISECDLLEVTTEGLADTYRSLRKEKTIAICPNSIDFENLDDMPTDMIQYEVREKRKFFVAMRQLKLGRDDHQRYNEYIQAALANDYKRRGVPYDETTFQALRANGHDLRFQVPDEIYNSETTGKKMIMWGGSPTHKEDLAVVTNPLMKTMKDNGEWLLGMVGFIHSDWLGIIDRQQLWQFGLVPVKYYYSLYKQVGATIGLAPVNRDAFNSGKSGLKSIEYMGLGIYAIASDFITYAGKPISDYEKEGVEVPEACIRGWCGPDVPLCRTEDDWEREIKKAMKDDDFRFEITQKNRLFVEENYNITKNIKYWKKAYEELI